MARRVGDRRSGRRSGCAGARAGGRTWLRRRLGLEPEDRRWFEEEGAEHAEHEGDEPLDTREARFSLRARLAEEGHGEPAAPEAPAAEPPPAFPAFESPRGTGRRAARARAARLPRVRAAGRPRRRRLPSRPRRRTPRSSRCRR